MELTKEKIGSIERQSILVGLFANLVMAMSGWATFYLSGSQALLLDGNLSFILFLSSIVALKINQVKSIRSVTFPFGLYVTEALYTLMKGLLILGVIISAITTNMSKILQYIEGEQLSMIKTGPILYYAIAMVIICWGLSYFYRVQNYRMNMASSLLSVDQKSAFIDGVLSASTGAVLVLIGYVHVGSSFEFLLYIGDAILVVLLATALIGQPVGVIKGAFVELAGGKLQNEAQHLVIEGKVHNQLSLLGLNADAINIGKTGSSYLIIVSISLSEFSDKSSDTAMALKSSLMAELSKSFSFIDVELVLV